MTLRGSKTLRRFTLLLLALTLAACAPLSDALGLASDTPTTSARKETRQARTRRPTRTPEEAERFTAPPSATPPREPTVTPPFQLVLPNATPTSPLPFALISSPTAPVFPTIGFASPPPPTQTPSDLACQLLWQSPPDGAEYFTGDHFSTGWNIRNTGTVTWQPGQFVFRYVGGAKLAYEDTIPLESSVAPGQDTVLSVPMRAPPNAHRSYTTHWGIQQGNIFFCRLTLTISAK